ncbi:release factor glutamine methyltransferase [Phytohabitans aurantiacus]|uniref:Release factor glutamine methyltransferase n=1 Tax=Phytohabitans aurantiacus TaxID=3016789 RepID=A0ABQ5QMQ6_9ACTN|nr:release factor glutamine methyltransferase [Phytohabitans aurantiacus]
MLHAVSSATITLTDAGLPSARVDAELLAAHVLDVPRGQLAIAAGFTSEQLTAYRSLVARRAAGEPVQHLIGSAPFRYLELAVGPGVFVPRPETELLAGWGIQGSGPAPVVVDLCSGSGAIALAVAQEVPGATVYAVERSPAALEWLRRNASGTGVTVVAGDASDPAVLAELDGRVDLVLCNPPYVPAGAPVPADVADHDPEDAVFAGPDGLAVIRPVIARAAALLRGGGRFGVEHDDTHGDAVPALLRADGRFTEVMDHQDLAGRPRFATASRSLAIGHGRLTPRDAL